MRRKAHLGANVGDFIIKSRNDDRKTTLEKIDTLYASLDEMIQQTPWQMYSKQMSCKQQVLDIVKPDENVLLAAFMFAPQGMIERHHQHICNHSAITTILGLERYKINHGRYPRTLEKLIDTGYIKAMPMDPYSDGSLIYRTAGDEFTLYSLAKNFKDDGGLHKEASDNKNYDNVFWPTWKPEEQSGTGNMTSMPGR